MADKTTTLYNLLNLSISAPGQGVVNFRAMHTLLLGILQKLDLLDVTVGWSDTCPAESSPERPGAEGQPATGKSEETGPDSVQEAEEDGRQVLEPSQQIQKQCEQLQANVRELRHQQDQATAVQSEFVKTLEALTRRVEALEQAEKGADNDHCYVTWEAMKSALVTERESLKKNLILTNDVKDELKDEDVSALAQDTTSASSRPSDDSRREVEVIQNAAPRLGPVTPLQSLSGEAFSAVHQETVEALRGIGQLKQHSDQLEERITALEQQRSQQHQELLELRQLLHNRGLEEKFDEMQRKLEEQVSLVQSLISERDKGVQEVGGVQKAILHLQRECEKLQETTRCLYEDNQQKQTHIKELYKATEQLEERKADKNMVETEMRADKRALDSKVSRLQFDSVTEQLNTMFNELLTKVTDQEQDWGKVMEKLSTEMDCKLNRIELDSMKKQLEARWKSIQKRMLSEGSPQQDDAAGIRRQLVERFHCLSCDRPVVKHVPGPQMMTLPMSPGFPAHRSMRPFTVYTLEQIRQHYRSLDPGTNRVTFKSTNSSRKREQLQKSYFSRCRQIERLRDDHRSEGQSRGPSQRQNPPERLVEVADYSLYSVSRSCGGSHTATPFAQRHRSMVQPTAPSTGPPSRLHAQSEEVDIVGLDGRIYKGRLNSSPSQAPKSKLPTIYTNDSQ